MYGLFTLLTPATARAVLRSGVLGGLMSIGSGAFAAADIQFNTDILDLDDHSNIDLSRFSRSGFILPGTYPMAVQINSLRQPEQPVAFHAPDDDPKGSQACLSPELVAQLGLKPAHMPELTWWRNGECLDIQSLPGMDVRGDLSTATLYVSLPHAYLQYSALNWDPPSRWDEGVPGLMIDYNLTAQSIREPGTPTFNDVTGNGALGVNAGPWRLRADWQGRFENDDANRQQALQWSRFYAYRALPSLSARLTLGENYLYSDLFDSFRFTGVSLHSDDSQLPPNLRGYAPEVVGVARTNAKVIISQQGRVLYNALVAAGPFRIQDLNDAVTGTLDVRVEEQDGSVQTFTVESASIPYLTRPGTVRYKLATGLPSDLRQGGQGKPFATGEFSWGVSNGWSLFGGGISDNNYKALTLGVGRDLLAFGAVSLDATKSHAEIEDEALSGASYRLSYSKSFDEYDTQVSFAGYRFSEKNYLSMSEYLNASEYGGPIGSSKALYTATFNKRFQDAELSVYLNYSNQSYWDRPDSERWSLSMARYFSVGNVKNMSLSLNLFQNQERDHYSGAKNNSTGMYVSVSLPLGKSGTLTTSANRASGSNSVSTRFSDRLDERNSYQLSASDKSLSGYLSHTGERADLTLSASMQERDHTTLSLSARGGGTLTPYGGALHRSSGVGGTRLMVDTSGVPDVPIRGSGVPTRSNSYGKAVVSDVSSFLRTAASVDIENLPANVEAIQSVTQLTLTEGAIGYRTLDMVSGHKAMAVLRLANGSVPPFGALVKNAKQQETGIVNDGGSVYLSGIEPGVKMMVSWDGAERCTLQMPARLPAGGLTSTLNLSCRMAGETNDAPAPASLSGPRTDTEKTPT